MNKTILLIEDNIHIMEINQNTLLEAGHNVIKAVDIKTAHELIIEKKPDLIVLDVMLPDGDGITFCHELRESGIDIPVLFLTAKSEKDDILEGLRAGGDDYLTKPYDLDIFLTKIEVLLRRCIQKADSPELITVGRITLDLISYRAFKDGKDLLLTPKEFQLLNQLSQSKAEYVTVTELYRNVWGIDVSGSISTIKERIFHIRRKLGENSGIQINNVRGKGYNLKILNK